MLDLHDLLYLLRISTLISVYLKHEYLGSDMAGNLSAQKSDAIQVVLDGKVQKMLDGCRKGITLAGINLGGVILDV